MTRRITVRGVRRADLDTQQIAIVLWLQAKREIRQKREREAAENAKRRERSQ
jgi:hypothetical protein